jgi:glycosyltransferase involved in cell wall biosynthesis
MLIQRYHPHIGGAENQLRSLLPRLQARGVRPLVITRRLAGTSSVELLDGAPVYRFAARGSKLRAGSEYVGSALSFLLRRRREIDVLHAHELLSPATVGLLAKWCGGPPLLVKVLRGGELSDLRALRRRPLGALRWAAYRRSVDRFVAISSEIERELLGEGIPAARVTRIPNGVDVDLYQPVAPGGQPALRAALGLRDAPTVIYAGRLAPEKRVETVLEAWPAVRARVPDAQLLVVGDGPSAPALRARATDGVRLLGAQDLVSPYLRASDVFVLPSVAEGLSNAMLEAMACGLPCVVHAHGGALDAVEDGVSGVFLADESVGAVTAALVRLLAHADARLEIGACGRAVVVDRYSLDSVADRLAALYRELAHRARRSSECAV